MIFCQHHMHLNLQSKFYRKDNQKPLTVNTDQSKKISQSIPLDNIAY